MKKIFVFLTYVIFTSFAFANEKSDLTKIDKVPNEIFREKISGKENGTNDVSNESIDFSKTEVKVPPKQDWDLRFYLPSLFGTITGKNSYMQFREDYTKVNKNICFEGESRGDIATVGNFSFSWSAGFNAYIEQQTQDINNYTFIGLSTGAGVYYHLRAEAFSLTGLYVFVYPVYNIPLYVINDATGKASYKDNGYYWKIAWDLGYTLALLDSITVSPYIRNSYGWTSSGCDFGLDFGIAVGLYFHDPNYYSY